jgi:CheY-like chemotaxis protein
MVVQGHIDVSRMGGADPLPMAGLQESLDRASSLLNQMRDVCGHPTLDFKPMNLNELIQEKLVSPAIHMDLAANLPFVAGDRDMLARMILNLADLILDGREVHPGRIRLSTYQETLEDAEVLRRYNGQGLDKGGDFVVLEIENPKGSLDSAPAWNGLGLVGLAGQQAWEGLPLPAIVRTVRDHRGGIELKQGQDGNRIRIHFPACPPQSAASSEVDSRPQARGILVVDDEEFLLLASQQMLSSLGYHTLTARSGREALEIHAREGASIGLILLDLNMPFVNGEETYREIRKVDPEVKVVLCTGSVAPSHEPYWMDANLSGILRKPFGYKDLQRLVEDLLPR